MLSDSDKEVRSIALKVLWSMFMLFCKSPKCPSYEVIKLGHKNGLEQFAEHVYRACSSKEMDHTLFDALLDLLTSLTPLNSGIDQKIAVQPRNLFEIMPTSDPVQQSMLSIIGTRSATSSTSSSSPSTASDVSPTPAAAPATAPTSSNALTTFHPISFAAFADNSQRTSHMFSADMHNPMLLSVCFSVLRDSPVAFRATCLKNLFVMLINKASTSGNCDFIIHRERWPLWFLELMTDIRVYASTQPPPTQDSNPSVSRGAPVYKRALSSPSSKSTATPASPTHAAASRASASSAAASSSSASSSSSAAAESKSPRSSLREQFEALMSHSDECVKYVMASLRQILFHGFSVLTGTEFMQVVGETLMHIRKFAGGWNRLSVRVARQLLMSLLAKMRETQNVADIRHTINGPRWQNAIQLIGVVLQFVLFAGYDAPVKRSSLEPELKLNKLEIELRLAETAQDEEDDEEDPLLATEPFLQVGAFADKLDDWDNNYEGTVALHLSPSGVCTDVELVLSGLALLSSMGLTKFDEAMAKQLDKKDTKALKYGSRLHGIFKTLTTLLPSRPSNPNSPNQPEVSTKRDSSKGQTVKNPPFVETLLLNVKKLLDDYNSKKTILYLRENFKYVGAAAAAVSKTAPVLQEGILKNIAEKDKEYYVQLCPHRISFAKSSKPVPPSDRSVIHLNLSEIVVSEEDETKTNSAASKTATSFHLLTPKETWSFNTPSADARNAWLDKLRKNILYARLQDGKFNGLSKFSL